MQIKECKHCGKQFEASRTNQIYCSVLRSVYKELHADHETGAADNK